MSSNVGLPTPRGSGTSGYVQRNMSALKPQRRTEPYPTQSDMARHRQRQPNKDILEHDRKRAIEIKVLELQDKLEDEGCVQANVSLRSTPLTDHRVDEDEIEDRTDALRKKLQAEDDGSAARKAAKDIKGHQVHDMAEAKINQQEKLRKALGIGKDYQEGDHWRKQEQRLMESVAKPEPRYDSDSDSDDSRDRSRRRRRRSRS